MWLGVRLYFLNISDKWRAKTNLIESGEITSTLPNSKELIVDKKSKKRLEVLRQKQEKQQVLLKAARAQTDEPGEVEKIESELEAINAEIAELRK